VKSPAQLSLLQDFYRDRLALMHRHIEGATRIADYEFNNTYQYVIAREELHLQWVRDAVTDLGGVAPTEVQPLPVPSEGKGAAAERAIMEDDARQAQEFVSRWRGRLEGVSNARHRKMLEVVLGEIVEHKRFFQQAVAGRDDLLGRRMPGASTGDGVLPVRWMV
jgi:hypothetical protein